MGVNISKQYLCKITDSLGLCRACTYVQKDLTTKKITTRSKDYKLVHCVLQDKPCYEVRHSMFDCDHYEEPKKRSSLMTFNSLWKAFVASIKTNSWQPLKEAAKNELQN